MELDELRIFQAVLQEDGVTRAAARLHRVQSNVTTRLRQLEDKLGVPLFLREGKKLIPTEAGRRLGDYAERLLSLAEEARQAVASAEPAGSLRLGAMESTAASRLAPVLAGYHRRYPTVQLELQAGVSNDLRRAVLEGRLDAALISGPAGDERLDEALVFEETIVLVAAAGQRELSLRLLGETTLLTFGHGCAYRQRLEAWMQRQGVQPRRLVELGSYHAMLSCVASGMGLALLPQSLLDSMPLMAAQVSTHPLPADLGQAQTTLIRRRGLRQPALDALQRLLLGEEN
ncbi:LysR family transcriptional regulator [Chromobacterium aquaticum]|uniref:LysR family transcriptional regulator n=1 Tax=Chromobacterium aquaticum TaxID=467180 RepID=A0ABV8ZTB1_9NEIS|nr:LysR family transcriptional regulator [Chromobacterium aquaticum]MCD5364565.1 LysR family transcriptional regulator [Chromobacterium aquaticum]RBH51827.1 LysR family transcriptional regulator [Pseudomonas sp. MWU13-2860]